jgi:hypothetical protein
MQPTTSYFTIAIDKSLLKHRHRDTIDHGKLIDCITHHVCQEIKRSRWRILLEVLMTTMLVGVESTKGDSSSGSPSKLLPAEPSGSLFLVFNIRIYMF